jgi:predicted GH43/DUF377 family glycosyl hydrolase
MAIDDYGPIKGFDLQRNDYDGTCDETGGANAANDVVANAQNVGVIGPTCSSASTGAAPVLETAGIVMISHSSTSPDLPPLGPTIFNRVVVEDPNFEDWDRKIGGLPSVRGWVDSFFDVYDYQPNPLAKYAYDATMLLLTRIDQVSTIDGSDNLVIDRAALAAAVRGTTDFAGVTDLISLDGTAGTAGNRLNLLLTTGDRYVATDGDDGDGNDCTDPMAPCATVQRGVAVANAYETVRVFGGTYFENVGIGISLTVEGGYSGPPRWTRDTDQNETILDGSGDPFDLGDWDGRSVRKVTVIPEGTGYTMWFDAQDILFASGIGRAVSEDGLAWQKTPADPVLVGTPDGWDGMSPEHAPFVLKEGGTYKMWYEGSGDFGTRHLGYATSTDGIQWNKYGDTPVLQAGPESYDQEAATHGTVLHEGGLYKLWYHAMGDEGPIIAYATSPNGLDWTKLGPSLTLEPGWDENALWGPSVLKVDDTYWMWYAGAGPVGPPAIGVVTSTDGLTWNRFLATPVLTEETPIGDPHVIFEEGDFKMWYNDFDQGVINYAESQDGISWTKSVSNPVLMPGDFGSTGRPAVTVERGEVVLDGLTITGGDTLRVGAVDAGGSPLTMRNCVVRDNATRWVPDAWASAGVLGGAPLNIVDSLFFSNQAGNGASALRPSGEVMVVNSLFYNNWGDAVVHSNQSIYLWNATLADNDSAVLFGPQGDFALVMTNTIVYGRIEDHMTPHCAGNTCIVNYSDIEGGWPDGAGNIDADPMFIDPGGGDYRLFGVSPCVDNGTPDGAPANDIDGTPRDSWPDMGAFEWAGSKIYVPLVFREFAP